MGKKTKCKACQPSRRIFLKLGIGSLAATTLTSIAAAIKFLVPPVLYEASQIFEAGTVNDFNSGKVKNIQMG